MDDGRFGTDYRPNCYVHHSMIQQNDIKNSHELRGFMTNNAASLRTQDDAKFTQHFSCPSCAYSLPDPNGHVKYWKKYNKSIGMDPCGLPICGNAPVPKKIKHNKHTKQQSWWSKIVKAIYA